MPWQRRPSPAKGRGLCEYLGLCFCSASSVVEDHCLFLSICTLHSLRHLPFSPDPRVSVPLFMLGCHELLFFFSDFAFWSREAKAYSSGPKSPVLLLF